MQEEIKADIEAVINIMPTLDMKPTQHNTLIMTAIYNSLSKVLEKIGGAENAGADNRAASDSE